VRRAAITSILALALASAAGCAAVPPWQRGLLAKQKMQIAPDPLSALHEQHVYEYREGSTGGYGSGGGGCGCN
jgi:hypothetical protein